MNADRPAPRGIPQFTEQDYEQDFAGRHLLHGVIAYWAARQPDALAIIDAAAGQEWSWARLKGAIDALAARLIELGLGRGDVVAASLPFSVEHILLEYACFTIGAIHAPLDLRLKGPEVIRCLTLARPRAYAFLGLTPMADFRPLGRAVQSACSFIERLIQFSPSQDVIEGALPAETLLAAPPPPPELIAALHKASEGVSENDGAQLIFTTGSTGYPKPALLSHRNITCQNMCLGGWLEVNQESRMLVNLPPSHVGGQAEQLMTPLFYGGTAVLLPVFDPVKSLQAIQDYGVTVLGQIPALFNLEWRLPNYADYNLSSLRIALYGGQQVPRTFLERLRMMAPRAGTGLGLTESGGFCTYTRMDLAPGESSSSIGCDMPVYPLSIRARMREDGAAGDELPDGEIGHICFRGPQTFLGYLGDPQATAKTLSTDGYLYTGDMGYRDEAGLRLTGRARWIIKPKGYLVFPAQVEDHFCEMSDQVAGCGVVGVEHNVYVEAIVAFVEPRPGAALSVEDLEKHARGIASYMRPLHYVLLQPGGMPLNRVAKTDYVRLLELAREEVARLRAAGGWDAAESVSDAV